MRLRKPAHTLMGAAAIVVMAAACNSASPTEPGAAPAELRAVRDATWAFHDFNSAVAAGYRTPIGEPCVETSAGAMGVHSPNQQLIGNPALDPAQPELLLYLPTGGGKFALVGVEYLQLLLLRNELTGQVAPWFSQAPWPAGFTIVNPVPELFGQKFQGPMPGHVPGMPWHYDLHMWAWSENPSGRFAQWNPSLSCKM